MAQSTHSRLALVASSPKVLAALIVPGASPATATAAFARKKQRGRGAQTRAIPAVLLALALGVAGPARPALAQCMITDPLPLQTLAIAPGESASVTVECTENCTFTNSTNDDEFSVTPEMAMLQPGVPAVFEISAADGATNNNTGRAILQFDCPSLNSSLEQELVVDGSLQTTIEEKPGGTDADPVSTRNGELFRRFPPDLDLGGPLPLRFERYYASNLLADGNIASKLGDNWLHNFRWEVHRTFGNNALLVTNRGRAVRFVRSGSSWLRVGRGDIPFQLADNAATNGLTLFDPRDQRIYEFSVGGSLLSIGDANGNLLTLNYSFDPITGLLLQSVSDGLGRTLTFTYDGSQRMTSVSDGTRTVSFGHTGSDLTSVTDAGGHTTTFAYDPSGLLTSITRPEGNTPVTQTYDAESRVVTQADADGNTTTFTYTAPDTVLTDPLGDTRVHTHSDQGELIVSQDRAGQTIRTDYDDLGRRTSITDRLGDVTRFSHHEPSGKLASITHADGTTTSFAYTARPVSAGTFHDLTQIIRRDGTARLFTYDAAGNLTSVEDASGATAASTYNTRGQALTTTNPLGGVTTNTYNADGTLATRTDPAGNTTRFEYDDRRRLTRVTFADDNSIALGYDERDLLTAFTDENGNAGNLLYDSNARLQETNGPVFSEFVYDANDRVSGITIASGPTTLGYDALGRLATRTDANGNVTTFSYDLGGRLAAIIDASGATRSFTYDAEGVLASFTDAGGNVSEFASDSMGRITQVTSPLQHVTALDYDAMGRVVAATDPLGRKTMVDRDPRGLVQAVTLAEPSVAVTHERNALGQTTKLTDPNGREWLRSYDVSGRLTSRTDPLGNVRAVAYDARNRPSTITLPGGLGTQTLTYDAAGNLTQVAHSDGTTFSYTYNARNQLVGANNGSGPVDQVTRAYEAESGRLSQTNGIPIARDAGKRIASMDFAPGKTITYGYDANNRVTQVTDWLGATTTLTYDARGLLTGIERPNGVVTTRAYDADGRLVSIGEAKAGGVAASIVLTRDAAGQITAATRDVPQVPSLDGLAELSQTVDAASQLSEGTHDALGRLTALGSDTYTWNLASQLVSYSVGGSAVESTYDALGRRIRRTQAGITRDYVWNDALGLPSISIERDGSTDLRYFVHTPDGRLLYSIEAASGERRFYHYDEMGNTIFLTDDAGSVIASYAYAPYGELIASTGTVANPFTWQGRFGVMDEGNGLYYARARYYDSRTARFLSRDPITSFTPKGANPYQYALANPKRFTDFTGTEPRVPIATTTHLDARLRELNEEFEFLSVFSRGAVLGGFAGEGVSKVTARLFELRLERLRQRDRRDRLLARERATEERFEELLGKPKGVRVGAEAVLMASEREAPRKRTGAAPASARPEPLIFFNPLETFIFLLSGHIMPEAVPLPRQDRLQDFLDSLKQESDETLPPSIAPELEPIVIIG